MTIPTIKTQRLILRAPSEDDFDVYKNFYADEDASSAYGGPLSELAAWKKLAADLGHWQLRGYGMWSLQEKQSGDMIGGCGLVWPRGWPRSELTWWIIPSARRKGYGFEASRAVVNYAYEVLKWPLVETHMNDENMPARQLALKLGGNVIERILFPDGLKRDIFKLPRG